MGAGTPIRPVQQSVDTPSADLSPNPFRAGSLQNTAGEAIAGVGNSLMGIWQAQQQHQNALNLNDRMDHFQQDIGQAKVNALNSGLQAPDMVKQFQDTSQSLITAYTTAPANKSIAPQLALAMRQHIADQMQTFPVDATERVMHDLDFKSRLQVNQAAQSAAAGYTVDGTVMNPTIRDSTTSLNGAPTGEDLTNHARAMINGAYDPAARSTENQVLNAQFDHEKAFQRGMLIAQDQPAAVTDAYLRSSDGTKLTAEEHTAVINAATEAVRRPAERFNAANANVDEQLTQKYLQQMHDGTFDQAQFDADANHQLLSPEHQQRILGYKYQPKGNPTAIAAMQHQIATAPDEDALETLRGTINGPQNAELYGKGAIPLLAQIDNQKRQLTTIEGRQRKQDYDQIKRAYQAIPGLVGGPEFYNKMAAVRGMPTMQDLTRNAVDDYNSAAFGIHDPAKLRAIRAQVIKDNAPDVKTLFPGLHIAPAPTSLPPTDEEAKALAHGAGIK